MSAISHRVFIAIVIACANIIHGITGFVLSNTSPVKIIFTDQTQNIQNGSEVRLNCVASGGSNPITTWVTTVGGLPSNARIMNGGHTLVIPKFELQDYRDYICVVSDGVSTDQHVFHVQSMTATTATPVRTSTPLVTSRTTTSVTTSKPLVTSSTAQPEYVAKVVQILIDPAVVRYGQTVRLQCLVSGHPNPTVSWQTTNQAEMQNAHVERDGRVLIFRNFSQANNGDYRCYASNFQADFKVIHLQGK